MACKGKWHIFQDKDFIAKDFPSYCTCKTFYFSFNFVLFWMLPKMFPKVTCPPPPGIANGNHSGQPSDSHLPGSAVQYSCRDGYSLIGNASISCTAKGTWSRPQPRCEANGCKRPAIENGRMTELETTYRLGDLIVFECDFGYALKGSQESYCQFGGTWDPPVPICEKMFIPGMSVKYYCDRGYVLTGKTTVSCLTSGIWSIPYPRCEGEL
uniref:Sushi domain-containing protein n=1 Tax=Athene cunicularia TaxID=194338 RepID=A0A663MC13_ATHCN